MEQFCGILILKTLADEYVKKSDIGKTYNCNSADAVSTVPESDSGTAQYGLR